MSPVTIKRLLVANRGEVAVRVARAATELGIEPVAVRAQDDTGAGHTRAVHAVGVLPGGGPRAYLDVEAVLTAARAARCDAVHPGWGLLAESAAFARRCEEAGLAFVGPAPATLETLGDKANARGLAERLGVPVLPGVSRAVSLQDARAFMSNGGAAVLKAVAGGGGRGMRVVRDASELDEAYARCASEAEAAFGDGRLYIERLLEGARHIEVQAFGDGRGGVAHLHERDCSLQRRHQKLIEIAPAPRLPAATREALLDATLRMAAEVRLRNAATFEFLVGQDGAWWFIEANPRLQVEHTITEEITGVDIVRAQLLLAGGAGLADLGLDAPAPPRGIAVQLRINTERIDRDGTIRPAGGVVSAWAPPGGPGVRVDTAAYAGYAPHPAFDSLLAKLIVHEPTGDLEALRRRALRALAEFRIAGVETNVPFLRALLDRPDALSGAAHTRYVDEHLAALVDAAEAHRPSGDDPGAAQGLAGARIDSSDPLAVLAHGKSGAQHAAFAADADVPEGLAAVRAPMQGTIMEISAAEGEALAAGQRLLIMEAMKMEHEVCVEQGGVLQRIIVAAGDAVYEGHVLALIEPADVGAADSDERGEMDLDRIREDLREVMDRHAIGLDAARPDAVERRRKTDQRTARENIADLCDEGSFVEYGPLVIAAQRRRRPVEELIERTPADGLVAGIGTVNAHLFGPERSRVIAMSYDYTVLAGTQGAQNHRKKDRMFELAERWRLPVIFFTEGGGGRPGDTDGLGVAGLDCWAFHYYGRLSGLVPLVGIVSGRCFAGNAALLGTCDVVIATRNANIGMGGPAMIEGGGLGIFRPEEIGPSSVQYANGVIDVLVDDEAEAVAAAKRYLAYFQGPLQTWTARDQRALRHVIPENRRRMYDVRTVIETMADGGSVLELRAGFGKGMITALARIEGRPIGIVANNPAHLAGAIDSEGADKASRFMQLCDAFDLPLLFLCDTPGIMVGPEIEKTALVRHAARMFVGGANVEVPVLTIILRKAYGLGAQAMAGGSFKAPFFTVSWPTGEFGGMGLEGAVKLGYRNELAAIDDPERRRAVFEEMVERMYTHGKAVNAASHFEIDDVIDPADSRRWIASALRSVPPPRARTGKKRPQVDTW